jgi:hypothetical protein
MKKLFSYFCLTFFGLFLLAFLSNTGTTKEPADTATKVLSIPGPAFEMPKETQKYTNNGVVNLITSGEYVRAPLTLPNKTRLKRLSLVCKDNSSSLSVTMWIHVFSHDLTESFTLCSVSSKGAQNTFRTFSTTNISPNKIDNTKYFYFLNVSLGTKVQGHELAGATLHYQGKW